jgi:predicted ribosome quality control (RQC) complex YloA/Tae2 family protein
MAFDAIMMGAIAKEISTKGVLKVEKIYQPVGDEIVILLRSFKESYKLLINAGSNYPRIHFTASQSENPAKAPMFCMLLRKHLAGAKLLSAFQTELERVCFLEFEAYDEMGFKSKKYLICEIMGKYSNLILTDADKKIISALKTIDFSTNTQRQILPGFSYYMPPKQDKIDPISFSRDSLARLFERVNKEIRTDKFITNNFLGLAPSTARQIAFLSGKTIDCTLENANYKILEDAFFDVMEGFDNNTLTPYIVYDEGGVPVEYSYMPIEYFGNGYKCQSVGSFCEAVDLF